MVLFMTFMKYVYSSDNKQLYFYAFPQCILCLHYSRSRCNYSGAINVRTYKQIESYLNNFVNVEIYMNLWEFK